MVMFLTLIYRVFYSLGTLCSITGYCILTKQPYSHFETPTHPSFVHVLFRITVYKYFMQHFIKINLEYHFLDSGAYFANYKKHDDTWSKKIKVMAFHPSLVIINIQFYLLLKSQWKWGMYRYTIHIFTTST